MSSESLNIAKKNRTKTNAKRQTIPLEYYQNI